MNVVECARCAQHKIFKVQSPVKNANGAKRKRNEKSTITNKNGKCESARAHTHVRARKKKKRGEKERPCRPNVAWICVLKGEKLRNYMKYSLSLRFIESTKKTHEEDCAKIFLANFQRKMHSIKMRCTHDVCACALVCLRESALTPKHTYKRQTKDCRPKAITLKNT